MEKIMQNKLALKIICTLLAVVLWIYVSYQENPTMTKTIDDVPITLSGEQALNENGLSVYSVSDNSISVIANAKRLTLARLTNKNTTGVINVSSFRKPGKYSVHVAVSSNVTSDPVFTAKGKNISVVIEPIETKTFNIDVSFEQGKAASDFKVESHNTTDKKVTVKAPESILNLVSSVKTETLSPAKEKQTAKLIAYDKNGVVLERVECIPAETDVTFSFYSFKTVPVVLKLKGGAEHKLPESSNIRIFGEKADIDKIEQIKTKPIDISVYEANSDVEARLSLPKGISLYDSKDSIVVNLKEEYFK
ncbi:MAG: hypothetical protein IJX50_00680 [Clostridia bacterium]|nr:hypothetical protein [Clostridia bacterium]